MESRVGQDEGDPLGSLMCPSLFVRLLAVAVQERCRSAGRPSEVRWSGCETYVKKGGNEYREGKVKPRGEINGCALSVCCPALLGAAAVDMANSLGCGGAKPARLLA